MFDIIDYRPKSCNPFLENGDSVYEWNILKRDEKQQTINQSIVKARVLVLQYFGFTLVKED